MHDLITTYRPTAEDKQRNKYAQIAKNAGADKSSHSGIQVWSRFVPVSTEDFWQAGYILGSNNLPFVLPECDRLAEGQFISGYNAGLANHRPFTEDGKIRK